MSKPQEDMRLIDLDLAMLKNWILDSGFIKPIFFDSVNQTTAVFMNKILPRLVKEFGNPAGYDNFLGVFLIYMRGFLETFIRAFIGSSMGSASQLDKVEVARMWVNTLFGSSVKELVLDALSNCNDL